MYPRRVIALKITVLLEPLFAQTFVSDPETSTFRQGSKKKCNKVTSSCKIKEFPSNSKTEESRVKGKQTSLIVNIVCRNENSYQ